MKVHYLEIVTPDVEGMIAIYAASYGVSFSAPMAEFGHGCLADMPDGGYVSIRAPMHEAEAPVTRPYFLTEDIETATEQAVAAGAELAHPVMEIAGRGKFSIMFHGSHQFGYWQL